MKKIALVLALLAVTLCPALAAADTYAVGYTTAGGYTWNGSYWAGSDGLLYSRAWVATPTYSTYNGCTYCTSTGYWSYSRYYAPAPVTYAPQARVRLSRDEAIKQAYTLAKLKAQQEYDYASDRADDELVIKLNDQLGNGRPNGLVPYGANYYSMYSGQYKIGAYGVVPSQTIFATQLQSYKQQVQLTGDPAIAVDLNRLNLAVGQGVEMVNSTLINGQTGAQAVAKVIADNEGKRQQARADYLGKLAIIDRILTEPSSLTIKTEATKSTPAPIPQVMPRLDEGRQQQQGGISQQLAAVKNLVESSCLKCHDGSNPKAAAFHVEMLWTKSAVELDAVYSRVKPTADPKLRMPPDAPLTWQQAALLSPGIIEALKPEVQALGKQPAKQ